MSWLRWMVRRCEGVLGWQGMAGLALLAASAMGWLAAIDPLDGQVETLKAEAASRHIEGRRQASAARDNDPAAQLEKFYAFFSRGEPLEAWLARLYEVGDRSGLTLRQAQYQPVDAEGLALERYRITVPITATYPQLRRFLAGVLTEIPIVSLDQVTLHRQRPGDAALEANLQFTLYLRHPS